MDNDLDKLFTLIRSEAEQIARTRGVSLSEVRKQIMLGLIGIETFESVGVRTGTDGRLTFVHGRAERPESDTSLDYEWADAFDRLLCVTAASGLQKKRAAEVSRG